MSAAEIISFVQIRATQWKVEARIKLFEKFGKIVDELLEEEDAEENFDIGKISARVLSMREQIAGTLLAVLSEKHALMEKFAAFANCPLCGKQSRSRGMRKKKIETLAGEAEINRPYFYCVPCGHGFYPLDEKLGLSSEHKQHDLQQLAAEISTELPYETAAEMFKRLTGHSFSSDSMHDVTNEVGDNLSVLDVAPSVEEIEAKVEKQKAEKSWRPIMVLAIDGAMVPTRPEESREGRKGRKLIRAKRAQWRGEWREAKGFRFYLTDCSRIEHVLSWHQVCTDEELATALKAVKTAGLIPEDRVRLCVVADGAKWIWKHVKELFPNSREILDYYHCSEHIHEIAELKYGGEGIKALEWVESTMARLFNGEVGPVVAGLRRMRGDNEETSGRIEKIAGYLERNAAKINYHSSRKAGYPIGSGGIESAHKFISQVRLKRSGAWWFVLNGNRMLALRCARYNGTFNKVFELFKEREKIRALKSLTIS